MADALDILRVAAPGIGMLAGGSVGGIIGTAASGAIGLAQAAKQDKEAMSKHQMIPPIEPEMAGYLADMRTKRSMYEAGMSRATQNRTRAIEDMGATAMANTLRAVGGDAGQGIDSLLRVQSQTNRSRSEATVPDQQAAMSLFAAEQPLLQDLSDRRYKLRIWERDKALGQAAGLQQDSMNNMQAAMQMLPSINWKGLFGEGMEFPGMEGLGAAGAGAAGSMGAIGDFGSSIASGMTI